MSQEQDTKPTTGGQAHKFTATSRAWLTGSGWQLCELQRSIEQRDGLGVIDAVVFSNSNMDDGPDPWACVGTAEITVTLHSRDSIVAAAVSALQKELDHERGKWLTKQQEILDRINKLQALEYVEAA